MINSLPVAKAGGVGMTRNVDHCRLKKLYSQDFECYSAHFDQQLRISVMDACGVLSIGSRDEAPMPGSR